ncbi:MAG: hypothetical protein HRU03_08220 [Nanoarchaeales archaeon]|nr:hypothetical protein [Nanoarchaeales archaeon]
MVSTEISKNIGYDDFNEYIDKYKLFFSERYNVPFDEVNNYINSYISKVKPVNNKSYLNVLVVLSENLHRRYGNMNSDITFKVIFIGKTRYSDYGVKKIYNNAINHWKTNSDEAIYKGYTNELGEPLYLKGYNKGKNIDLRKIYSRTLIGVILDNGVVKPFKFNLNKFDENYKIPLFKKIKIRGYKSKNMKEKYLCGGSTPTTRVKIIEDKYVNLDKYLSFFEKESSMDVDDINELSEDINNYDDFFILKSNFKLEQLDSKCKVVFTPINSNYLTTDYEKILLEHSNDGCDRFVGYTDEKINIINSIDEGYIIGKPYLTYENKLEFQIYGIWSLNEFNK